MDEQENSNQIEINNEEIIKAEEIIKIHKKTPLITTTLISTILYEAGNMFYHFITQKDSFTSYIKDNIHFFKNTLLPNAQNISNYIYENSGMSIGITGGIAAGLFLLQKIRNYVPGTTIKKVKTDAEGLELVSEITYEKSNYYFLENIISVANEKYVRPILYSIMGITAGVSTIGGTYGSFIKDDLHVLKNVYQVLDNYSAILLTAGTGVVLLCSNTIASHISNIGRGFYEKYLFLDSTINSLERDEKSKEKFETAEREKKVVVMNEKVKDLVKKLNEKNRLTKQNQNPNQNKQ